MNISNDIKVKNVLFDKDMMTVALNDGRFISVPLDWFPRLQNASADALQQWELSGAGHGIHWPTLDEDISVEGLLFGQPTHINKHTSQSLRS